MFVGLDWRRGGGFGCIYLLLDARFWGFMFGTVSFGFRGLGWFVIGRRIGGLCVGYV